jgi:molybdopterin converting factor small subunit
MKVELHYYSMLKDLKGPDHLELPEGATAGALLDELYEKMPGFRDWEKHIRIAAGNDWIDRNHVIRTHEIISLMPPVQGG